MTDTLLAALVTYGALLMFLTAFLSCVAVPIPMSLVMITGGALAAQGDLSFTWIWSATVLGAVLGDQAGYFLGQRGKSALEGRRKGAVEFVEVALVFHHRRAGEVIEGFGVIGRDARAQG